MNIGNVVLDLNLASTIALGIVMGVFVFHFAANLLSIAIKKAFGGGPINAKQTFTSDGIYASVAISKEHMDTIGRSSPTKS